MSTVTKLTRDQYVALVKAGGKAFGFYGGIVPSGVQNEDHARFCLTTGSYDERADGDNPEWVYYTLTE